MSRRDIRSALAYVDGLAESPLKDSLKRIRQTALHKGIYAKFYFTRMLEKRVPRNEDEKRILEKLKSLVNEDAT